MNYEKMFVSFYGRTHRHPEGAESIAWKRGVGRFMTAGGGVICTWDADSGELLETLEETTKELVAFDPWGDNVVWDSSGCRMFIGTNICDAATGAVLQSIASSGAPECGWDECVSWELNGHRIAIATDEKFFIVDSYTGELLKGFNAPGWKWSVCWCGDGDCLAVIGETLRIWDARTGELLKEIDAHDGHGYYVGCEAGGGRIATSGLNLETKIWDRESGTLLKRIGRVFGQITWAPNGKSMIVGDYLVRLDGNSGDLDVHSKAIQVLPGDRVSAAALEHNGRRIVVFDSGKDNRMSIYDTQTDATLHYVSYHYESKCIYLDWEPGGNRLFSVGEFGGIVLWNTETATWQSIETRFRNDGTPCWKNECLMARRYKSDEIAVTKISSGEVLSRHRIPAGADLLDCSARFSPDNSKILVLSATGKLLVADAGSGEFRETMPVCPDEIQVYGWNNTASRVALAGDGGRVYLRDMPSGNFLRVLPRGNSQVTALCWEDDVDQIAVGNENGEIEVWNAQSGELVVLLAGHIGPVNAISWISNPPRIASAGEDGRLLIHDSASMTLLHSLNAESGPLSSASWESSGRRIAVGGDANTIFIWQCTGGKDNPSFQIQVELEASYQSGIARTPAGYAKCSGDLKEIRLIEKLETPDKLRRTIWHPLGDLGPVFCNPDRFQAAFHGQLTRANLIEDIDAFRKGSSEAKLEAILPLETAPELKPVVKANAPEPELSLWKRMLKRLLRPDQ